MTTSKIVLIALIAGALGVGLAAFAPRWLDGGRDFNAPVPVGGDSETDRLDRLPRFQLPDTCGQEIASSHWKGKVLVLNFWATWCPPCRAEMPEFQSASVKYNGQATILGVDQGEPPSIVSDFGNALSITYPLLVDQENVASRDYNVTALPTTAFIDGQGVVREISTGMVSKAVLEDRIERLIAEG